MSRIVTDDRIARFVGERCGTVIYPPFTAMGLERDGDVFAGVVFNCFTRNDIALTAAGPVFDRRLLRAVGAYVFHQLGCLRMSFTTEQKQVVNYLERIGAQVEGRKRNHFGAGRHGIVLGILKDDWRY